MYDAGHPAARPIATTAAHDTRAEQDVNRSRAGSPGPTLATRAAPACAVPPGATFLSVLGAFGLPTEAFDEITIRHSERVATYAMAISTALGLTRTEIATIRLGAYLHDVGKLKVPQEILRKPGRLTPEEFAVVQMHPLWGLEVLEGIRLPVDVRPTVRWHHEKYDGSGYPDGLKGERIPLHASIVGVADVYDALTSSRSYRPPMTSSGALALMWARRGWWRPEVYAAFGRAVAATMVGASLLVGAAACQPRDAAGVAAVQP